jgi:hypothetical protein
MGASRALPASASMTESKDPIPAGLEGSLFAKRVVDAARRVGGQDTKDAIR